MFEIHGKTSPEIVALNEKFVILFEREIPEPAHSDVFAHTQWLTERFRRFKIFLARGFQTIEDRRVTGRRMSDSLS